MKQYLTFIFRPQEYLAASGEDELRLRKIKPRHRRGEQPRIPQADTAPLAVRLFIAIFLLVGLISPSLAAETEIAQSKSVQKGVQEVETSVEGLVTARDENISDDLALRIDAFKKVIDLSLAEAKNLQVRALLIEKEPKEMALWREKILVEIEDAVRHFELLKKKGVAHLKDVQAVKAEAEEFRLWREENYTPAMRAVNDYSSLQKGQEVLLVARERAQKIAKDIVKLGKSGTRAAELQSRLQRASALIAEGEKNIRTGEEMFQNLYIFPLTVTSTDIFLAATSSASATSLVLQTPLPPSVSTSSAVTSSSPLSLAPEEAKIPLSIKELVRSSFDGVKDAYQVFIEMSGLVRKSL